ncbi:hypothetical protein Xmau_03112 [Xenorhabdus mauleonii]|uniref:Uncharacterized protein n=1 Tax=Xenorhabdus mauleonii TaxID=351675 RepID=A0A1I3SJ36_9GAMM|nr:hypothetical protein [Xenorhabdus mauleonii]PHM39205.1 hypothetical protein Xmau_03112 [Xenorhabdus mauleonii]SFJ58734.1 hypothetical protein SAMN05421680_111133 [Xenorhabdus mauleonii]
MLNNEKQIAAFRALAAEGLHPPAALGIAKSTADNALEKAALLRQLVKAETRYPASVTYAVNKVTDVIGKLTVSANAAHAFHNAINGYQNPSPLTQMRIGWACYLKGHLLPDNTPFYLIEAIADTDITTTQHRLVAGINTGDIQAAMKEINSRLDNRLGAGGLIPTLSDEQITRLTDTAEALTRSLENLDKATEAVNRLATQANDSANRAQKAFNDAVSVSIISGLLESPVMTGALKAITPVSVIAALS